MTETEVTDITPATQGPSASRRTQLVAAAVVLVIALGTAALLFRLTAPTTPAPSPSAQTSTDPATFDLPRLSGSGHLRLADFHGKPLVVNFFASWCDPCRLELPGFAAASRQLQGRVGFLGVNSQETGDGLAMARLYGIGSWPLARDVDGQNASGLHDSLGAVGMPATAFYDSNGRLLFVHPGQISKEDLIAKIHDLYGIVA